jgi:RecA/RadA recombinase
MSKLHCGILWYGISFRLWNIILGLVAVIPRFAVMIPRQEPTEQMARPEQTMSSINRYMNKQLDTVVKHFIDSFITVHQSHQI